MHKLDDVLLHFGVKGMKWDEKFLSDQDKQDLKKIKKAVSKNVSANIAKRVSKIKAMPGNAKKRVLKNLEFMKNNPKQAAKNVTGITKKEAQDRRANMQRFKESSRDTQAMVNAITKSQQLNKGLSLSEQVDRNNGKSREAILKDRAKAKAAQKQAIHDLPKNLKKAAIQTAKNKLGITKGEAKSRATSSRLNKLDAHDTNKNGSYVKTEISKVKGKKYIDAITYDKTGNMTSVRSTLSSKHEKKKSNTDKFVDALNSKSKSENKARKSNTVKVANKLKKALISTAKAANKEFGGSYNTTGYKTQGNAGSEGIKRAGKDVAAKSKPVRNKINTTASNAVRNSAPYQKALSTKNSIVSRANAAEQKRNATKSAMKKEHEKVVKRVKATASAMGHEHEKVVKNVKKKVSNFLYGKGGKKSNKPTFTSMR